MHAVFIRRTLPQARVLEVLVAVDAMPFRSVTYAMADWLFLRALGVIYLAAFVSLGVQLKGLIGRNGILPAAIFLDDLKAVLGRARVALPTLCWFSTSDRFLAFLCWGGAALS